MWGKMVKPFVIPKLSTLTLLTIVFYTFLSINQKSPQQANQTDVPFYLVEFSQSYPQDILSIFSLLCMFEQK
jgi:hypothetical protein